MYTKIQTLCKKQEHLGNVLIYKKPDTLTLSHPQVRAKIFSANEKKNTKGLSDEERVNFVRPKRNRYKKNAKKSGTKNRNGQILSSF